MKTCSKCKVKKELDAFYKESSNHDGRYAYCKECKRESNKMQNKLKGKMKTCTKCGIEKPLNEFTKAVSNKDGRTGSCESLSLIHI